MASLELDKASGRYRVRFRHAGGAFKRSLKTSDRREAKAVLGRVEETIRLLERGRLDLPSDSDPGLFILSDGKLNGKAVAPKGYSLAGLVRLYLQSLPEGAKAHSTLSARSDRGARDEVTWRGVNTMPRAARVKRRDSSPG